MPRTQFSKTTRGLIWESVALDLTFCSLKSLKCYRPLSEKGCWVGGTSGLIKTAFGLAALSSPQQSEEKNLSAVRKCLFFSVTCRHLCLISMKALHLLDRNTGGSGWHFLICDIPQAQTQGMLLRSSAVKCRKGLVIYRQAPGREQKGQKGISGLKNSDHSV